MRLGLLIWVVWCCVVLLLWCRNKQCRCHCSMCPNRRHSHYVWASMKHHNRTELTLCLFLHWLLFMEREGAPRCNGSWQSCERFQRKQDYGPNTISCCLVIPNASSLSRVTYVRSNRSPTLIDVTLRRWTDVVNVGGPTTQDTRRAKPTTQHT